MEEEEGTPTLGKLFGFLMIIAGLGLIVIGASYLVEIPGLPSQFQELASYLSSVGTVDMFLFGILAIALGVGLIRAQEWAAGGSFVLLLIVIVHLSLYIYYSITSGTLTWTSYSIIGSSIVVVLSIIILIYLVKAVGWK